MAKSLNQVTLMGNLTRDPELRNTPGGQSVCNIGLALNRSFKNQQGEWQEVTDFVDIVVWGPQGERVAQYLSKGRRCLVTGRLQSRSWEQDGQKRSKLEVLANDVTFLDGPGGGQGSGAGAGRQGDEGGAPAPAAAPAGGNKKQEDVVIEDIGDEPIDLSDIPF